ncbi:DNA cytosine methyltransferase [Rhizobium rhizogenes]|uniref:DNA cytosine methyltransferase n=1 Tax=Rhizobium rhizogenes TaxID=359 RepID=UPI0015717D01|nr:DNA cytosine methyltransferase [Rhizobium rhizogenes]NTG07127.1 DNA (cytosine-5-)-methyltransferase [Rhizobium rhizogenes]
MRYGSVCSGIEAATRAWHPLGWEPAFFSEIEAFPSAVLAHHYGSNMPGEALSSNGVPNLGDMTQFEEWSDYAIDLLVGGTPCQDYSIAGLRAGMDGIRGSLTLTYAAIARRYRPRWLAWENVPGVLSLNGGRDFASFLGLLSGQRIEVPRNGWRNAGVVPGYHRAYGLAWRVLDAQYIRVDGFGRAVPQRRRRVFIVGYLGDWRRAAAVLLEREGLLGDSAPIRKAGEDSAARTGFGVTGSLTRGYGAKLGTDESVSGNDIAAHVDEVARCDTAGYAQRLDWETENFVAYGGNNCSGPIAAAASLAAHGGPAGRMDFASETFIVANPLRAQSQHSHRLDSDNDVVARATHEVADTLTSNGDAHSGFPEAAGLVAHSLRAEGYDASEDGTGRGTPIVPVPMTLAIRGRNGEPDIEWRQDGTANAILTPNGGRGGIGVGAVMHEVRPINTMVGLRHESLGDRTGLGIGAADDPAFTLSKSHSHAEQHGLAVRRLTPRECERLQGFPDDFTAIPHRGKTAADGPRYKALGNSMAVNVMRWIGRRIEMVEQITKGDTA